MYHGFRLLKVVKQQTSAIDGSAAEKTVYMDLRSSRFVC